MPRFGKRPKLRVQQIDRRITKSGGTRYLAIGQILPPEWDMVRLNLLKLEGGVAVVSISRLEVVSGRTSAK